MSNPQVSTFSCDKGDWRRCLFGPNILENKQQNRDEEEATEEAGVLIPFQEAFDTKLYDYIAVFIGADYCPHCKAFAPTVISSAETLEKEKRCKVVFVSNDRTEEAFRASCRKVSGIDVVPYDLDKTRTMRDLFDLKTIPALSKCDIVSIVRSDVTVYWVSGFSTCYLLIVSYCSMKK